MPAAPVDGGGVQAKQPTSRPGARSRTTDFLATYMAAQSEANQQSVADTIGKQAGMDTSFDPSKFLSAQRNLLKVGSEPATVPEKGHLPTGGRVASVEGNFKKDEQPRVENPRVAAAQLEYNDQLRARRADALNVDPTQSSQDEPVKVKLDRMSWDEYNNMTPLQKAAIDYNTMLVKAIRTDRRQGAQGNYDGTVDQENTYAGAIKEMFPENPVSNQYSPATVSLLRQIGYKDDSAGSLDDFLNLDAVLSEEDIKNLGASEELGLRRTGAGSALFNDPAEAERLNMLGSLARGTLSAQSAALEKGNKLLEKFSMEVMAGARGDDAVRLGGVDTTSNALGIGNDDEDVAFQQGFAQIASGAAMAEVQSVLDKSMGPAQAKKFGSYVTFRQAYDLLADKTVPAETVLYSLNSSLSPQERKQFIAFAEKRMLDAERNGLALTDSANIGEMRTPTELAQVLQLRGMGKKGGE